MPNCTEPWLDLGRQGRRRIVGNFGGGNVSSDGGVTLLGLLDKRLGLCKAVARALGDPRDPGRIQHELVSLIRQRVYGMCLGHEDLNDHDELRTDVALQSAVDTEAALASSPTLCRLENRAGRAAAWALHEVLIDQFIASHEQPPEELVLDFDATDVPVHGMQQDRFFHGYYDHYCYLPLYVFCGEQLLVAYLRPSRIDGAKHGAAILRLLVNRLRRAWPQVKIIVRADSGFCRQRLVRWCERQRVGYVIGLARNKRLIRAVGHWHEPMHQAYEKTGIKQRELRQFYYAARSWDKRRRVITRLEYTERGTNPRFIITNLPGSMQYLYDDLYCARGEAENRIKEAQIGLFATRTSCHYFAANQFRILLSGLAYTLFERMRHLVLKGTELARAQADTIRTKLLKVGAVVTANTRTIRLRFSSAYPHRGLFALIVARLHAT